MLAEAVAESHGEYVAFIANDCIVKPGWLREAMECMLSTFTDGVGLVGFADSVWGPNDAAPHWVASKGLLPLLDGFYFWPGYSHVACDLELTSRCRQAGKYAFAEKARIIHDHYCSGAQFDEVYWVASNPQRVDSDHDLLKERAKLLGFPIPEITRRFSDQMRFFDAPQEIHPERLFVIKHVPPPRQGGGLIVDVGCGRNKTITDSFGVDILPGADFQCSLDDLPFADGTVESLISRHSLEHVLDTVKALREWRRVLQPDGKVVIVLPDHSAIDTMHPFYGSGLHLHAFTQDSFRHLLEATGIFRIEEMGIVVPEWSFGGVLRPL